MKARNSISVVVFAWHKMSVVSCAVAFLERASYSVKVMSINIILLILEAMVKGYLYCRAAAISWIPTLLIVWLYILS